MEESKTLDDFWESLSEFDAIIKERAERPPTRLHVDMNHYSEVDAAAVVRFVLATPPLPRGGALAIEALPLQPLDAVCPDASLDDQLDGLLLDVRPPGAARDDGGDYRPAVWGWDGASSTAGDRGARAVTIRDLELDGPPAAAAEGAAAASEDLVVAVSYRGTAAAVHFRLRASVVPPCVAEPIDADAGAVVRTNREGEWTFFRYVFAPPGGAPRPARPRRVLSLRLRPQTDGASGETVGDADLYVSNAHHGVGAVGRDNCAWKATSVGAVRIDIHPADPRAAAEYTRVRVCACLRVI